jgi:transglutaminase-like putative cysteine protease
MMFDVNHRTTYHYDAPVAQSHHLLHLSPRPLERQRTIQHTIVIDPKPAARSEFVDYFGNPAVNIAIEQSHAQLSIHSRSLVDVTQPPPVDRWASAPWESVAARLQAGRPGYDLEVLQYLAPSRYTNVSGELLQFAIPSFAPKRPVLECAQDLMRRIFHGFRYDPSATDVATTVDDVLRIRRGVCQDFAHLFIASMRAFGLSARYVSGYLLTRPPEGTERLIGADASHAWAAVWAPGVGWMDFDPTNNIVPGAEHITVAYGRDFQDVSPVTGVLLGGGSHTVEVAVDVAPVVAVEASAS